MNVSSTYLSDIDGFSDIDPTAISSKYSMYMLANTGDNRELITRTSASVSLVGTFVNRLTTFKLTIWLEWMRPSLIISTMWAEFLTYDENLPASGQMISTRKRLNGWHAEPLLLTMGLSRIASLWIFGRPYMCGSLL